MKTIIVFLKYYDSDSWCGKELLSKGGTIIWAGYNILQQTGDDGTRWDEIMVADYNNDEAYNEIIAQLAMKDKLKNCKVLLVERYPNAQMDKVNNMLSSFTKGKVDTKGGVSMEEAFEDSHLESTPETKKLFADRDPKLPFINLSINKYYDKAAYPEEYTGDKSISGKDAYKLYGRSVVQYQGIYGAQLDVAGRNKDTVVGNKDDDWDEFVFVRFPNIQAIVNVYGVKAMQDNLVHREAGLKRTFVYTITPYD
ncbi:MAG: hypothetical protein ACTSPS_15095 [Promethearchaeota archaeon]